MPLYVVAFVEAGGYRCRCRIRAAAMADHLELAVKKIWGAAAFWVPQAGSPSVGRVYERVGDPEEPGGDHPRTALTTVEITPVRRTP
jgi:hypothetical protein